MKVPNWLLWIVVLMGAATVARAPRIDWAADAVYTATTLFLLGLSVAAGVVLFRRGAFSSLKAARTDKNESD